MVVVVSTFLFSYIYRVYRDHQPLGEYIDKRLAKKEELQEAPDAKSDRGRES